MEKENNGKPAAPARKKKARSWEIEKLIAKKIFWLALIILALAWLDTSVHFSASIKDERSAVRKWQAVFLNNGQIYFGHFSRSGISYWKLSDAYYIKVTKVPVAQPETKPGEKKNETPEPPQEETRTTLVKVTDDLHGPENTMFIPASNILFWQNLRDDSSIVRAIAAPSASR